MSVLTHNQVEENLRRYWLEESPTRRQRGTERVRSFDYCYNHFQAFRERGDSASVATPLELERSCLHLGFYLASWGMMRGSSELSQRSVRHLIPVLELIAATPETLWAIDVDLYSDGNIPLLVDLERRIREKASGTRFATDTLSTKIMLGVFGNVPAFDSFFRAGFGVSGFSAKALRRLRDFHDQRSEALRPKEPTLHFLTGQPTTRLYTKAKLVDMVFFVHGGG